MKKKFRLGILVLALIGLLAPAGMAFAGEITSFTASIEDGKMTTSGKAADGVYAVQVLVYNEAGTELVTMQSTGVNADGTFSETISVNEGTYLVKAADYAGGSFKEMTVKYEKPEKGGEEEKKAKEPGTGDSSLVILFALLGTMSIITIAGVAYRASKR